MDNNSVQVPSMGRVVHYVDEAGEAFPAIVRLNRERAPFVVDLTAFTHCSVVLPVVRVPYSAEHVPGSWHWPERVDATKSPAPSSSGQTWEIGRLTGGMAFDLSVYPDGNASCALVGDNLQEGLSGFGHTPLAALRALADELERVGVA